MPPTAVFGLLLAGVLSQPLMAAVASAQAAKPPAPEPSLTLDLNAVQPSNGGCRLTFVVTNGLATPLERAAFEMALFDRKGVVGRLTVLDFKQLPAGKTRVSRFDLPGTECADISRVLVNDATECTGPGTDPKACLSALQTVSTSGVRFGR